MLLVIDYYATKLDVKYMLRSTQKMTLNAVKRKDGGESECLCLKFEQVIKKLQIYSKHSYTLTCKDISLYTFLLSDSD